MLVFCIILFSAFLMRHIILFSLLIIIAYNWYQISFSSPASRQCKASHLVCVLWDGQPMARHGA
jgi:hypothetical protein